MTAALHAHRRLPDALHVLLARIFDRSRGEERTAAARYWAAIGHDMPLEDRSHRLRELAGEPPVIKVRHRPGVSG